MLKIKSKTIILLIILFLTSCVNKNIEENIIVDSFPEMYSLTGTTINSPVTMLSPIKNCIINDKLIVYDAVKNDLFKVFKLPDLDYLFSWGNIGRGPDEFLSIDNNYIRVFNNVLELLDRGRLIKILVNENSMTIKSITGLPNLQNPINGLQKINDSIYIIDNIFTDGEFEHLLINVQTNKIIKKFGKYPDDRLNIKNSLQKYQIYFKSNISSPNKGIFIVFYMYFNRIKIYNRQGELQKNISLRDREIKKYSVEPQINNPIYFAFPYATEKYFYVLRLNKTDDEIIKNIDKYNPELLIWDWNGNPIAKCKLDKPIFGYYAISEKYKKLYGTNLMKENEIYVFDLPDVCFD